MPRHPSTDALLRWFAYDHPPAGQPRRTSQMTYHLAHDLAEELPDGPELSAGLRKLLEAKDCFVRAAMDTQPIQVKAERVDGGP